MLYLKLLDLKAKLIIIMVIASVAATIIGNLPSFGHAVAKSTRRSQTNMQVARDWRLK